MNEVEKTAWIDEENKIVSFHAIDNGKMVMKTEIVIGLSGGRHNMGVPGETGGLLRSKHL